ncbi:hypothetical protein C7S17_4191 [Burkholderia thailandensis]|nr:hypothetical protein [Burkholderia thailandensis]
MPCIVRERVTRLFRSYAICRVWRGISFVVTVTGGYFEESFVYMIFRLNDAFD